MEKKRFWPEIEGQNNPPVKFFDNAELIYENKYPDIPLLYDEYTFDMSYPASYPAYVNKYRTLTGDEITGTVSLDQLHLELVDKYVTGFLNLTLTVSGNSASRNETFPIVITLSDKEITDTFGEVNFVNGVATTELKHGMAFSAKRLPSGVSYELTITDSKGYDITTTGTSGVIPEYSNASCYINCYKGSQHSGGDN